jgi:hypothetical protein
MAEACLHGLERQLKATIGLPVDAPGCVGVSKPSMPVYLGLPSAVTSPAAIMAECRVRCTMCGRSSTPPQVLGNAGPSDADRSAEARARADNR